jgi:hypothetical protein
VGLEGSECSVTIHILARCEMEAPSPSITNLYSKSAALYYRFLKSDIVYLLTEFSIVSDSNISDMPVSDMQFFFPSKA